MLELEPSCYHLSDSIQGRAVTPVIAGRASPIISSIFIIKAARHVMFKQRVDTHGAAAMSCASSQTAQSLTNRAEHVPFAFLLFVTTVIFVDTRDANIKQLPLLYHS